MGHFIPCVYCLEIPPLDRSRRGEIHRCPLCKTEILETATGASYRLRTEEGDEITPPPAKTNRLLAFFGLGAGSSAVLLAWLLLPSLDEHKPQAEIQSTLAPLAGQPAEVSAMPPPSPPVLEADSKSSAAEAPPVRGEFKDRGLAAPWPKSKRGAGELTANLKTEHGVVPPVVAAAPPARKSETPTSLIAHAYEEMATLLEKTPELLLEKITPEEKSARQAREKIASLAKTIQKHNQDAIDGFIKHVRNERADLAGLPFRMSPDCQLPRKQGEYFWASATMVRRLLEKAESSKYNAYIRPTDPGSKAENFWSMWSQADWRSPAVPRVRVAIDGMDKITTLPALVQILQTEDPHYRTGLVGYLAQEKRVEASQVLAQRAVFDPSPEVRKAALAALKDRPRKEFTKFLLDGLRYPWAPAAQNAALAVADLECHELVPDLMALLDAPDPADPFAAMLDNKPVTKIRELVKINHHKNCLLCHAPSTERTDLVRALVPDPSSELPPSASVAYYDAGKGDTVVRADITYLRQDFSLMLPVANPGPGCSALISSSAKGSSMTGKPPSGKKHNTRGTKPPRPIARPSSLPCGN